MLLKLSNEISECYSRAVEARACAEGATDPSIRADYLAAEQRWLSLAHSYEFAERLSRFTQSFRNQNRHKRTRGPLPAIGADH
jgi:hypothetical protein